MTQLRALTHATDPKIGGFVATFPSGLTKEVIWKSTTPAPDSLRAAKEFTAGLLDQLLQEGATDDANRTNWASMTAAVQRIISDFGARRLQALKALDPSPTH
jgi:hypothetical protein